MSRRNIIVFVYLLIGVCQGGAFETGRAATAIVSFESALTKVFPDAPPPQGKPSWDLALARGERESFQLLILAGKAGLKNVSVRNVFRGKLRVIPRRSLDVACAHRDVGRDAELREPVQRAFYAKSPPGISGPASPFRQVVSAWRGGAGSPRIAARSH